MISSKFIGRKASPCRKCSGDSHFVNKLGGIQCAECSPAKHDTDIVMRLRIDGGLWQDAAAERFDFVDVHMGTLADFGSNPASAQPATKKEDEKREDRKEESIAHPLFRGPGGELSRREDFLFLHDDIWNGSGKTIELSSGMIAEQNGSNITIKPKVRKLLKKV